MGPPLLSNIEIFQTSNPCLYCLYCYFSKYHKPQPLSVFFEISQGKNMSKININIEIPQKITRNKHVKNKPKYWNTTNKIFLFWIYHEKNHTKQTKTPPSRPKKQTNQKERTPSSRAQMPPISHQSKKPTRITYVNRNQWNQRNRGFFFWEGKGRKKRRRLFPKNTVIAILTE